MDWTYWGCPLPGFGDPDADIILLGLAPAAHGANRTGRMFTGDRSGDFLFAALHRAGLANQQGSKHRDDGLTLSRVYITAACRCAPPENKPTPEELEACAPFLEREFQLLRHGRVILALGKIAFDTYLRFLNRQNIFVPKPRPKFGHGVVYKNKNWPHALVGVYHPSQQNTNTGRLTPKMFDRVLRKSIRLSSKQS